MEKNIRAGGGYAMGVTIVGEKFAADKAAMDRLIKDYAASVRYVAA